MVLSIWLGMRESLKEFWIDGHTHFAIFFSVWLWGVISHHCALGYAGREVSNPRPDRGGWAVGRNTPGLVQVCLTDLCGVQGRVNCMIFGIWGSYRKQHIKGILGPSLVCKTSGIPKVKRRKIFRHDHCVLHSSAAGCTERGSGGLGP